MWGDWNLTSSSRRVATAQNTSYKAVAFLRGAWGPYPRMGPCPQLAPTFHTLGLYNVTYTTGADAPQVYKLTTVKLLLAFTSSLCPQIHVGPK